MAHFAEARKNYWGGWVETASREQIKALQESRLREQVKWVYSRSRFWHDAFTKVGITPDDVKTIEDLKKVPFTNKELQGKLQEEDPPYGGFLCYPLEEIQRQGAMIWHSSGTTRQQRMFTCSIDEFRSHNSEQCARHLWTAGVRPGDVVLLTWPIGLWIAGLGFWNARDMLGITVIPAGPPLDTKFRLSMMETYKPNCLLATPSYCLYLAQVASELGIDVRKFKLKLMILGGEPLPSATRQRIEEMWDVHGKIRDFTGLSEACGHIAMECEHTDGMHCYEDIHIYEVLDPNGVNPVKPGDPGELVITSLGQKAMATGFHFRVADIVTYTDEPCACGRTTRRIKILSRKDDMKKIRGINLFISPFEEIVRGTKELGNEFQVVVENKKGLDTVTLYVEAQPGVSEESLPLIQKHVEESIYYSFGLHVPVQFEPFGSLPSFELKAKRWLDKRVL